MKPIFPNIYLITQYGLLSHAGPGEIICTYITCMYVDTNSGKIDFSSFPLAQSAWGCLPVERPGKYIAHSCATLKINQNWPLHDDVIEIYQRHI